jgi:16S rRNA (guanine527-N7)-methyltransferase
MTMPIGIMSLEPTLRSRLDIYAELLRKWQAKINLVGPSTLPELWVRHFDDSLQLLPMAGTWTHWVDLGSGGGFPGLVIAIASEGQGRTVHLVESDKRKSAFLREVSRETQTKVEIHVGRIETVLPQLVSRVGVDVVSARALAPLCDLIEYARPAIEKGAIGLFLKGKALPSELTEVGSSASLNLTLVDSRTDSNAKIVVVRGYDSKPASV